MLQYYKLPEYKKLTKQNNVQVSGNLYYISAIQSVIGRKSTSINIKRLIRDLINIVKHYCYLNGIEYFVIPSNFTILIQSMSVVK